MIRASLNKNKLATDLFQAKNDSLVNAENYNKSDIVSFDFNEKKIDSLIALGVTDYELYKVMGMSEDSNWLTKHLYAQVLKFYK
ncbi:hypothetical protein [Thalassobellus suaedae]|uniref:Uncharacterized protein n=1 Tax=Thalassobellus suaedae TaxID=3074124 RepID=A0ABY9Y265_9FLAO|nr:hypothetical protein RHP49_15070 [Flavobacteriaceae bacterium HL-DH10]